MSVPPPRERKCKKTEVKAKHTQTKEREREKEDPFFPLKEKAARVDLLCLSLSLMDALSLALTTMEKANREREEKGMEALFFCCRERERGEPRHVVVVSPWMKGFFSRTTDRKVVMCG